MEDGKRCNFSIMRQKKRLFTQRYKRLIDTEAGEQQNVLVYLLGYSITGRNFPTGKTYAQKKNIVPEFTEVMMLENMFENICRTESSSYN